MFLFWNHSYWISLYICEEPPRHEAVFMEPLTTCRPAETPKSFDNFNSFRPWGCKEWSDGLNESEVDFDAVAKKGRYEKGCIRTSPNRQVGGRKKEEKKEKVTAAVAYYGTKAVRDMQRPWVKAPVGGSHWFPLFESIGLPTGASHMRRQQKKQFEHKWGTDRLWLLPNRPWRNKFDWVTAKWRPLHNRKWS